MRTCLVTGANSGIGKEIARALARAGDRVVLVCRDAQRGEAARREISEATGNPAVELEIADLGRPASVRELAGRFLQAHRELHVLVNNAGVWATRRRETADGIEQTWAVNVLGYFLLTELLLPRLRESAPGRIVNVASQLAGDLDLDDVEFRRRPYSGVKAYSQSKQADRMLSWALARRLEGSGVTVNAMHPGAVNTPLFAKGGGVLGMVASIFGKVTGRTPEEGADTVVWLATDPGVAGENGEFWVDRRKVRCRFHDSAAEERLWSLCASMTRARA
jgi:NAD(P)-dependent dehydrogenase (short-subunit alcohol dehydrogenase family)